jgi:hypothetical protein
MIDDELLKKMEQKVSLAEVFGSQFHQSEHTDSGRPQFAGSLQNTPSSFRCLWRK